MSEQTVPRHYAISSCSYNATSSNQPRKSQLFVIKATGYVCFGLVFPIDISHCIKYQIRNNVGSIGHRSCRKIMKETLNIILHESCTLLDARERLQA